MGDLDRIVNVSVTKQTAAVSRVGFGVPMLMSTEAEVDSKFTGNAKIYTGIDELGTTGDAFDPTGVTFRKATAIFSQNPRPGQIVVGKRQSLPLMDVLLTPIVVASTLYRITINGTNFDFTSDATPTAAEIITALETAINAGAEDVLATDVGVGTSLQIEKAVTPGGAATAGRLFTIEFNRSLWAFQNVTADPGLSNDLSNISDETQGGNDDWYCALLDSSGDPEIQALALAIEALGNRIFVAASADADILTASATDTASDLLASAFDRTALLWHENPHTGPDAAWAGNMLPRDPGSATWAFKTLAGIARSILTSAETLFIEGKQATWYKTTAGNNHTYQGQTFASGGFLDITRGIDFIVQRIKENVFGQLINLPKIPYTDSGIAIVQNEVEGVMQLGIANNIFTADPAPVVTVPKANDVDSNDRANRILRDVDFTAQLAGAVHNVIVQGVVTV